MRPLRPSFSRRTRNTAIPVIDAFQNSSGAAPAAIGPQGGTAKDVAERNLDISLEAEIPASLADLGVYLLASLSRVQTEAARRSTRLSCAWRSGGGSWSQEPRARS